MRDQTAISNEEASVQRPNLDWQRSQSHEITETLVEMYGVVLEALLGQIGIEEARQNQHDYRIPRFSVVLRGQVAEIAETVVDHGDEFLLDDLEQRISHGNVAELADALAYLARQIRWAIHSDVLGQFEQYPNGQRQTVRLLLHQVRFRFALEA